MFAHACICALVRACLPVCVYECEWLCVYIDLIVHVCMRGDVPHINAMRLDPILSVHSVHVYMLCVYVYVCDVSE